MLCAPVATPAHLEPPITSRPIEVGAAPVPGKERALAEMAQRHSLATIRNLQASSSRSEASRALDRDGWRARRDTAGHDTAGRPRVARAHCSGTSAATLPDQVAEPDTNGSIPAAQQQGRAFAGPTCSASGGSQALAQPAHSACSGDDVRRQ